MLLDTPTDARVKLVVELIQALKRAGGYRPGTPMQTEITGQVMQVLRSAARGASSDEVVVQVHEMGVHLNDHLLSFEEPGVAAMTGHMLNRHTTSVTIPKEVPVDDLWRFLVIFGGPADEIAAAGGAINALADAGVFTIQLEEEEVSVELLLPRTDVPGDDATSSATDLRKQTGSWEPIPEVEAFGSGDESMTREIPMEMREDVAPREPEEITPWQAVSDEIDEADMGENTRQAMRGGDTARSDLSNTDAPPTTLDLITRQIIRSRRPDGPDEAAVELLKAWRKIFKFESEDGQLPARPIAITLQRVDPLVRFQILARLANTAEGRAISGLIPDGPLVDALVEAVLALPEITKLAVGMLRTVRPRGAILYKLLNQVGNSLEEKDNAKVEAWEEIRTELANDLIHR